MQTLYAFFQSENDNLSNGEKELLKSIDKITEMFATLVSVATEIINFLDKEQENAKTKFIPTAENLNPNKRLYNNIIHQFFIRNRDYNAKKNQYAIHWKNSQDLIRKIYNKVRESEQYLSYVNTEPSIEEDKKFYMTLVSDFIATDEIFISLLEEENVYWHDDFDLVYNALIKFIKTLSNDANEFTTLPEIYKDEIDDKDFMIGLFRKTILNNSEYDTLLSKYTKNWEMERIAMMDILLMKMAIAEATNFENIPIKVTLNEYIEISKNYSTPRSSIFINGNLDKIIADLKREGKIVKTGRGLIE
jgi:N utilization substance protein B